jgi:hypothetical protein
MLWSQEAVEPSGRGHENLRKPQIAAALAKEQQVGSKTCLNLAFGKGIRANFGAISNRICREGIDRRHE